MKWEPNNTLARRRRLTVPLKRLAASAARSLIGSDRPLTPLPPESRILVLALNRGVGDMVLLAPALQALLDRFGGRRVTVLVRRRILGDWLARLVDGGRVLCLEEFPSRRRLLETLRRGRFDAAVDFVFGDWRTQVLARRCGASTTLGVDIGRPTLYQRTVPVSPTANAVEIWRRLASVLGAPEPPPASIRLTPDERLTAEARLLAAGVGPRHRVVGFHPGARDAVDVLERRWPTENWVKLARLLEAIGLRCVVFGTASEADRLRPLREASPQILWQVGRTSLPETAAMIERLDLLVGSNSGLMHTAAALGVPTISFACGVYLPRWRPWGPARMHHVMTASPACAPARCWLCRWAGQACLESIAPEEVAGWVMTNVQPSMTDEKANSHVLS